MMPNETKNCEFCSVTAEIEIQTKLFVAVYDKYPVNEGHLLVIPRRHIESIFELNDEEWLDFSLAISVAKKELERKYSPGGYNIGVNEGGAAGKTIGHLHIHIIPRYWGDVEVPKGGIRNIKKPVIDY